MASKKKPEGGHTDQAQTGIEYLQALQALPGQDYTQQYNRLYEQILEYKKRFEYPYKQLPPMPQKYIPADEYTRPSKRLVLTLEALEALSLLAAESDTGEVELSFRHDEAMRMSVTTLSARVDNQGYAAEIRVADEYSSDFADATLKEHLQQRAQEMADRVCEQVGSE